MAIQFAATASVPPITADVLATYRRLHPDQDPTRLEKAVQLVREGAVERTADPRVWLVVSQSCGTSAYRVIGGQCHCPDASRRDARRCKHAASVALYQLAERVEVDLDGVSVDEPIGYVLTVEAIRWLDGEAVDLPRQCSRCHSENAILTHRDGLGARCIAGELYGDDNDAA